MKYRKFLSKIEENNNDYISKKQLQAIFNEVYSNTTLKTFKNAIAILKNEQKIFSINNDYYSIVRKNVYEFVENKETEKIHNIINKEYPNIKFIVWNTSVINEFTLHYSMRDYIIVETEKLSIELIVNLLKYKENGHDEKQGRTRLDRRNDRHDEAGQDRLDRWQ